MALPKILPKKRKYGFAYNRSVHSILVKYSYITCPVTGRMMIRVTRSGGAIEILTPKRFNIIYKAWP